MGANASVSTTVTEITKETITNLLISSSNKCESNNINTQTINISDIETIGCDVDISGITQELDITTNFSCAQESTNSADIQNQLKENLKNDIETKASAGIGISLAVNTQLQQSFEKAVNNINMTSIAECVATNLNTQTQNIGKIKMTCPNGGSLKIRDLRQSIVSSTVNSCVQSNQSLQQALNELQTEVDNVSKTSSEGIFSGLGGSFVIFLIIAIVMGGLVQSGALDAKKDDNSSSGSLISKGNFLSKMKGFKR